jgi:hypothetical protein
MKKGFITYPSGPSRNWSLTEVIHPHAEYGTNPDPELMKPAIDDTRFGSITIEGERIEHDVYITLEGKVKKRKKKLSKAIYGTSHTISRDEIKHVYQGGSEGLIVGCGQYGVAELSDEAAEFLQEKECRVVIRPTPEAVEEWNRTEGRWIGLFHITC